eukprot:CFRG4135T1
MDLEPQIENAGARLVAIGTGNQFFANSFKDGLPFSGDVYRDPEALTFKAMNLKRLSYWEVISRFFFSFASLSFAKTMKEKYPTSNMEGDGLQTGAVYVISKEGEIKYAFIEDESAPDVFADNDAIEKALEALTKTEKQDGSA